MTQNVRKYFDYISRKIFSDSVICSNRVRVFSGPVSVWSASKASNSLVSLHM